MSKTLDARNARLRAKAGDKPYSKIVLDTEKTCPYCDEYLRPVKMGEFKCGCGIWDYSWTEFDSWTYKPAPTPAQEVGND